MRHLRNYTVRLLAVTVLSASPAVCRSIDFLSIDPALAFALGKGNTELNAKISSQTVKMAEMALEQNGMGLMFNGIKGWEKKYNSYLKTTLGYAEALKAGTAIYSQAVVTLRNIHDIRKAAEINPQGIASSLVMSDIYIDTAMEFITTFRLLNTALAKGGKNNMLTGKERTEMLWTLCDRMEDLNKRLRCLAMSIAYYQFSDVWRLATRGIVIRDKGEIARESLGRWKRVDRAVRAMTD